MERPPARSPPGRGARAPGRVAAGCASPPRTRGPLAGARRPPARPARPPPPRPGSRGGGPGEVVSSASAKPFEAEESFPRNGAPRAESRAFAALSKLQKTLGRSFPSQLRHLLCGLSQREVKSAATRSSRRLRASRSPGGPSRAPREEKARGVEGAAAGRSGGEFGPREVPPQAALPEDPEAWRPLPARSAPSKACFHPRAEQSASPRASFVRFPPLATRAARPAGLRPLCPLAQAVEGCCCCCCCWALQAPPPQA
ncbi:myristoylated alanine-rich C-kinase substrate-like [Peromyscus leucopus]|uniref:myristoylated alanine-rich C-kinase substrate-like n=1 Tax=Peromyscus leucopus TaxID=10041 RepID=UPI0010A1B655|nr:myristoylated alanine-rich C-kinase substrate-like [Peromyscus leucopus]